MIVRNVEIDEPDPAAVEFTVKDRCPNRFEPKFACMLVKYDHDYRPAVPFSYVTIAPNSGGQLLTPQEICLDAHPIKGRATHEFRRACILRKATM